MAQPARGRGGRGGGQSGPHNHHQGHQHHQGGGGHQHHHQGGGHHHHKDSTPQRPENGSDTNSSGGRGGYGRGGGGRGGGRGEGPGCRRRLPSDTEQVLLQRLNALGDRVLSRPVVRLLDEDVDDDIICAVDAALFRLAGLDYARVLTRSSRYALVRFPSRECIEYLLTVAERCFYTVRGDVKPRPPLRSFPSRVRWSRCPVLAVDGSTTRRVEAPFQCWREENGTTHLRCFQLDGFALLQRWCPDDYSDAKSAELIVDEDTLVKAYEDLVRGGESGGMESRFSPQRGKEKPAVAMHAVFEKDWAAKANLGETSVLTGVKCTFELTEAVTVDYPLAYEHVEAWLDNEAEYLPSAVKDTLNAMMALSDKWNDAAATASGIGSGGKLMMTEGGQLVRVPRRFDASKVTGIEAIHKHANFVALAMACGGQFAVSCGLVNPAAHDLCSKRTGDRPITGVPTLVHQHVEPSYYNFVVGRQPPVAAQRVSLGSKPSDAYQPALGVMRRGSSLAGQLHLRALIEAGDAMVTDFEPNIPTVANGAAPAAEEHPLASMIVQLANDELDGSDEMPIGERLWREVKNCKRALWVGYLFETADGPDKAAGDFVRCYIPGLDVPVLALPTKLFAGMQTHLFLPFGITVENRPPGADIPGAGPPPGPTPKGRMRFTRTVQGNEVAVYPHLGEFATDPADFLQVKWAREVLGAWAGSSSSTLAEIRAKFRESALGGVDTPSTEAIGVAAASSGSSSPAKAAASAGGGGAGK